MKNAQLVFTEKHRISFAAANLCKGAVRFFLIVAVIFGSVALAALSSLFSSMGVPDAAFVLSGLLHVSFFTSSVSALAAQQFFWGEKHYSRALRGMDVNALSSKVRSGDTNKAVKDTLLKTAWFPLVLGGVLYIAIPLDIFRLNFTCMAVHHTLEDKPDYNLTYRVKQLNCPDLKISPQERRADEG